MIDIQKLNRTKDDNSIKKAEELIKNIGIPSNPKIVLDINHEMNKIKIDFKVIAELVEKDVALSAKVLKIANSPFFSTRKSDTIEQALLVLGITNFYNIIVTAALRESVDNYSTNKAFNDKFLKHSSMVAHTARFIAKKIKSPLIEMAYMAGLFHDCAVPLFVKKYKDYEEIAGLAMGTVPIDALKGNYKSIIGLEEQRYSTNHCIAGYMVARSWHLNETICDAICYHHYINLEIQKNSTVEQLISLLIISEYIVECYESSSTRSNNKDTKEWALLHRQPMSALSIDINDLLDLREDVFEQLDTAE